MSREKNMEKRQEDVLEKEVHLANVLLVSLSRTSFAYHLGRKEDPRRRTGEALKEEQENGRHKDTGGKRIRGKLACNNNDSSGCGTRAEGM